MGEADNSFSVEDPAILAVSRIFPLDCEYVYNRNSHYESCGIMPDIVSRNCCDVHKGDEHPSEIT